MATSNVNCGGGGSALEQDTTGENTMGQLSGTGAIKKTNVNSKMLPNNKEKQKKNRSKWIPHNKRYFRSDAENMSYDNAENYHSSKNHSNNQHDYPYPENFKISKSYNKNEFHESTNWHSLENGSSTSELTFRCLKPQSSFKRNSQQKRKNINKNIPAQYNENENNYVEYNKKGIGRDENDLNGDFENGNSKYNEINAHQNRHKNDFRYKSWKEKNSKFYVDEFNSNRYYHNMRYKNGGSNRNNRQGYSGLRKPQKELKNELEIASQRERLEGMLKRRNLECLVCCELLKPHIEVWSCKQCYNILHLKCTQAWAKSSKIENGWRCPACQNVCKEIPSEYLCFCEKSKNPRNIPGLIPHSCGEVCLKNGRNCDHRCSILCHPGPCPDCNILVDKSCGCGKTKQQVMCCSELKLTCSNDCGKLLNCQVHKCNAKCHIGDCEPCTEILHQTCFCQKQFREVPCNSDFQGYKKYSCEGLCEKPLKCGNHKCEEICHEGACKPCSKDCSLIKTCFCGKKPLATPRTSCLDPIPSCGLLCQKKLKCGPSTERHKCEFPCHDGDCPPCNLTTVLRCRCGSMNKEISCSKLIDDDVRCERKCTKKRLCGKHKCNQRCCIEMEHICPLPCNRTLSCGNHRCELTCHSGRCKPCIETSFEELYCECGSQVMYPPIPCGTRPPECNMPCSRPRECGHEVNHACHTGPCPPCTILCKRWCYGNHEQRGAIPCHQEEFSCGLPCGLVMPCGRHKCISSCHSGACPVPCKQPCTSERSACGHPCLAACHEPPCPATTCRSKVSVSCVCGLQKSTRTCNEVINVIRNIELAQISEKMLNMLKNQPVDISEMSSKPKRPDILKILECTEECRVIERNRRLAIGLQIRNPDITQKLTPRYSDFMKGWAKKDPHFCQKIHDKLTELVQLAKQSQQKTRSYSFESMNRDKRQFVHEYCEHFGCESEAYDAEPNRNVVATAMRDKSWLPSMSLLEVIQRENGQRKVPMPSHLERNMCSKSESVTLKPLNRTIRMNVPMNDLENLKK